MSKSNLILILQLEKQLELQLMRHGIQHEDSQRLLLQYGKVASSYADIQQSEQQIEILTKVYKKLLSLGVSIISNLSNQHWKLMIVIAIKLSKAMESKGQLQQGLNILIELEMFVKQCNKSLDWANEVELQELYYILAIFWDKLKNKERKYYAANECILLIKSQIKSNHTKKQINMLIQMLEFQLSTVNSNNQQLSLYTEIHKYSKISLGDEHQKTKQTLLKMQQIKQQILFEEELEEHSKIELKKPLSKQDSTKHLITDKMRQSLQDNNNLTFKKLIKPSCSKHTQRRGSFYEINRNNSQSKLSIQITHQSRKSLDDIKKSNDQTTKSKLNSRTISQGENQFYYFLNCNNLESRNKTDTTQFQTIIAKNQDKPILSSNINKTIQTIQSQKTQECLDNKNAKTNQNAKLLNLMIQRPKSGVNQQNYMKNSQILNQVKPSKSKGSSSSIQYKNDPLKKVLKQMNTQEFNNTKNKQVLVTELSTKKSNQVLDAMHQLTSQKSINILGELMQQQNQVDYFEQNLDKIIRIQKYFKWKIDSTRLRLDSIKINQAQQYSNEEKMTEKVPETITKPQIFRNFIKRSNTSSVESLKFIHKKEAYLQPKIIQKQKDCSFYSQTSSNLMNIKSESEINFKEKTQEQQIQQTLENLQFGYEYQVQGDCNFFCTDQSDQILRFIGFKSRLINNESLVFYFTIEKSIRSYQICLPIQFISDHWNSQSQFEGLSFCQNQLSEFIELNLIKIPFASSILIYMGDNFDETLTSIVQLLSIIMVNVCEKKQINGKKLFYTNQIQAKLNKKLIQSYYQKQRQEKRQYYFKPQNFETEDCSLKINLRVSQTDLNFKDSVESGSQKQERKAQNGSIIYTIRTNPIIEQFQEYKSTTKLLLLEEPESSYLQMLDVSIREPEINQFTMKALNIPENLLSPQYQERRRFNSRLLTQSRIQFAQRNQYTLTPTASQTKKTNQLLLPQQKQRKILRRPQTSVCLVEETSSSRSQDSILLLNNQSKDHELQFASVSQSASLSFQPPLTSFQRRNIANVSSSQQQLFNSGHILLDTQMNLIGNEIFETDDLKIHDIALEEEDELNCKMRTVFKKCDYFTVSPLWKQDRDVKIQNFDVEYFWNQVKFEKQIFKSIYNNPFQLNEILLIGILKIDKQYFIVSVSQVLKSNIELFNQQVLKMKDLVKIQIVFELIFPFDNVWKDSATITFKEFIKWFISDFEISQYVQQFGLSKLQKISVLQYLSQFAHIKDSKLKLEYYEERKKEFQLKKIQRRTLEIQRMEAIENIFLRDKIDISYISNLGLQNLYQELLKDREAKNQNQQRRDNKYKAFLQLTDPSKLDPITQIPKFIGLDYDGESEEQTIQLPNYEELKILQSYNTIVNIHQKQQIFRHNSIYYIWTNKKLKIWRPFQRKIWQQIQIKNEEKLLNAIQSNLRSYFLNQMICKSLSLNGKKLLQKEKFLQEKQASNFNLLQTYFQLEQFTNQQFYDFLNLLNYALISGDKTQKFWESQFYQYKQLSHSKVALLGDCFFEIIIYFNKPSNVLKQNKRRYIMIKVNLFSKDNMKTNSYKLVLTLEDLQNTLKKSYDLNDSNFIQTLFNDVQQLMRRYVRYERFSNSRRPTIFIKNIKQGKTEKFINELPWIANYDYDNLDLTPYPQKFQFFHQQIKCINLICTTIEFIKLPLNFINRYQVHKKLTQNKIPSIIIIQEIQDMKTYYIEIYLPQSCRRLICRIPFNQIHTLSDMSMEIFKDYGNSISITKRERFWRNLIKSFTFSINQEMKLILKIENIQVESILQEVLQYEIKSIEKTKEVILFKTFIEEKRKQGSEYFNIEYPLRLNEAKNINMVIQLQWLNQQEKIQQYRLPLYELMMGYFDKQLSNLNIFDYKFRIIDLIKMSEIQVENIRINYSLDLEMKQNDNFQFLMPHRIYQNECQTIKLNVNLRTLQINKSSFKLLFRGILQQRPQILVGIYQKYEKSKLYFQIQRVIDGQLLLYTIEFEDIDNQYPGFQQNLKVNQREVGQNIFRMFKEKLILQCQYQLN
ncbi:unnamed protein product (macronuclear) [Paramecium tetraurelia]|uniref:Uncharacterized protein n=1 Tax=Paramecium tetraurelia TaxID=5888 RepID=A0DDE0_PARTE|nr:uncharacterized protein GSPATT00015916001 [Paramecium tetraurelia]CAK81057.1 unnamed protein product [Paramecium tetraurelia]|eukprot:XP_001448454.1 hypothetical protein (macronuclear) [Paramecium tetraurelia strain d4-2]